MADMVSLLNAKSTTDVRPNLKCSDLEIGKEYPVLGFKRVTNKNKKYGEHSLLAVCDFGGKIGETDFTSADVWLPKRFISILDEGKIEDYNKKPDYVLIYKGVGKNNEFVVNFVKRN